MLKKLLVAFLVALGHTSLVLPTNAKSPPNVVVIYADDLGYGDLSCYGHPTIRTPHLDRMAATGVRFTDFYSAACVCTPSRAALLTGRLPIRSGMCSDKRRVLFPDSKGGIPATEILLPEALKQLGYATACFGKWHLGHLPAYLPTNNGFDTYFGIPYSNDMDRVANKGPKGRSIFWQPKAEYWNVPLLRDTKVAERPADQTTITRRCTEEAIGFIKKNKSKPFFVYVPHSLPHVPLFRGKAFEGKSRRGLYGDVIEEIDWSVGKIIQTLKEEGLDKNTVVWFSSDNGPWLIFNDHGGSAGLLREGKGSTWDGGMREPGIVWSGNPELVKGGRIAGDIASTMDIYTTSIKMAGGEVPSDRIVDGVDLSALMNGKGSGPRKTMYFYRGAQLYAVRHGAFKAHFVTRPGYGRGAPEKHDPPLLYNLEIDPSEKWDVSSKHADVITAIEKIAAAHKAKLIAPPSQLENQNIK